MTDKRTDILHQKIIAQTEIILTPIIPLSLCWWMVFHRQHCTLNTLTLLTSLVAVDFWVIMQCAPSIRRKHGLYVHRNHEGLLGTGKLGSGEFFFISNTYSLHCHHQNDSALKAGSCMSHFNVCGQSHKTVSINDHFWRERRAEADWTEVLLLTSLAPYR